MPISESKIQNFWMLFCVMSKSPWRVKGSITTMERLLVQKEVQMEKKNQCWAHLFLGKLNDQHEVAQVSAKLMLVNSCILLSINSVLESQQTAVQFRRWYLLFTRFLTHTAWKSQQLKSDFTQVVLAKWAETISNIWSLSHFFIHLKRYFSVMLKLPWITTDVLSL